MSATVTTPATTGELIGLDRGVRDRPGPARPRSTPEPEGRRHRARPGGRPCLAQTIARRRALVRRRRLVLGAVATALAAALALPWGGAGGHPLATPGPALAGDSIAAHQVYVVQPGDTLWTIAERLDPAGDPRATTDELAAQVGSDSVMPGERIVLP